MRRQKLKILFLNLGYCTGINGFLGQYLAKFHRYIFLSKKIESRTIEGFKDILNREKPDLVCLVEIKKGRQIRSMIDSRYLFYDAKNKYGKRSLLKKSPFFYNKGNAFIAREEYPFKIHYLKSGTKKLVYEILLPGKISLLLVHLSLSRRIRTKQFRSLDELPLENNRRVICGDFNILSGLKELSQLISSTDLEIINPSPTFPAYRPKKYLDLFLCSSNIRAKSRVLDEQISDHLPIVLEIEF